MVQQVPAGLAQTKIPNAGARTLVHAQTDLPIVDIGPITRFDLRCLAQKQPSQQRHEPWQSPRHFTSVSLATEIFTGPIKPAALNGESFFHSRQVVNVCRPVGLGSPRCSHSGHFTNVPFGLRSLSSGNCSSPIIRFGQSVTTATSNSLVPARNACVISAR